MDEETWEATDEAFRDLTVGSAVRDEAEENPIIAEWLHALLDRRVTEASDRRLFGLKPLISSGLKLVESDEIPDDDVEPQPHYQDVLFRRDDGVVVAFPWATLRSWVLDATGGQLVFIWPEVEVFLKGQQFDGLEEKIRRRSIGEFRQIAPGKASDVTDSVPVIEVMQFEFKGSAK